MEGLPRCPGRNVRFTRGDVRITRNRGNRMHAVLRRPHLMLRESSSTSACAFSARLNAREKSFTATASLALARKLRMVRRISRWSGATFRSSIRRYLRSTPSILASASRWNRHSSSWLRSDERTGGGGGGGSGFTGGGFCGGGFCGAAGREATGAFGAAQPAVVTATSTSITSGLIAAAPLDYF